MLYLIVYILNLYDLLITHIGVNIMQVATEDNLLMAPILDTWLIVLIKVGIIGLVLWQLWQRRKYKIVRAGAICLLIFYSLIAIGNTLVVLGIW